MIKLFFNVVNDNQCLHMYASALQVGTMVHACNFSIQEAEAGGLKHLRPAWATGEPVSEGTKLEWSGGKTLS